MHRKPWPKRLDHYRDVPRDAWLNHFIYIYPPIFGDKDFDLYSPGPNGIDEQGKGDDIVNW
ncbi:MAG: type II secretion system protein GspG [Candidatus Thiodiazotropha sp.]